jgi:YD repeat-containing protein
MVQKDYTDYDVNSNNVYFPKTFSTQVGNNSRETRFEYPNHDVRGNPLYEIKDNNEKTVYLWSYSHQYPIAEIKNATYEQVKAALGFTDAQIESLSEQPNFSVFISWVDSELRNYFKDKVASVSTYTYKPPLGMITSTDPYGTATYYNYDSFWRLKTVKNNDGNTLNNYQYNYAEKKSNCLKVDCDIANLSGGIIGNISVVNPFTFEVKVSFNTGTDQPWWSGEYIKIGRTKGNWILDRELSASVNLGKYGAWLIKIDTAGYIYVTLLSMIGPDVTVPLTVSIACIDLVFCTR